MQACFLTVAACCQLQHATKLAVSCDKQCCRCAAVVRFFDTAQGKAQGHLVQHSSDIVAVSLNQQGIAPDRQVSPAHHSQATLPANCLLSFVEPFLEVSFVRVLPKGYVTFLPCVFTVCSRLFTADHLRNWFSRPVFTGSGQQSCLTGSGAVRLLDRLYTVRLPDWP